MKWCQLVPVPLHPRTSEESFSERNKLEETNEGNVSIDKNNSCSEKKKFFEKRIFVNIERHFEELKELKFNTLEIKSLVGLFERLW